MRKGIVFAVIVTWLIVSFFPAISATSLLGRRKG